jgi:hypothetical protein
MGKKGELTSRELDWLGTRILRQGDPSARAHQDTRANFRRKSGFAELLNDKSFPSEVWFEKFMNEEGLKERIFTGRRAKRPKNPYSDRSLFRYWRNFPVGIYYLDFAFPPYRVGIEVDGGSHNNELRKAKDVCKDHYLTGKGWLILRVDHGDLVRAVALARKLGRLREQTLRWVDQFYAKAQTIDAKLVRFYERDDRAEIVRDLFEGRVPDAKGAEFYTNQKKKPPVEPPPLEVELNRPGPPIRSYAISKKLVDHWARRTGESPRKVYFWLVEEARRKDKG